MQVVDELASKLACDPVEIDPLAESIDPEALDTLMAADTGTKVTFEHAGFTIHASSNGEGTSIDLTRNVHLAD
jgi:uncharacterized ParB-like nuclease family protein